MRWGAALRDIALIIAATLLATLPIAYTQGYRGVPFAQTLGALGVSSALIMVFGFALSGALSRERRWRHASVVAVGLWLTGVVNVVLMPKLLALWLVSCIPVLVFMGLGVSLSFLFVRPTREGVGSLLQSDAPNTPSPPELK